MSHVSDWKRREKTTFIAEEEDGDGESVVLRAQGTDVGGENGGKHVDAPIDQVNGGSALLRETVERGVGGKIKGDVGDVDADFVVIGELAERACVIDVDTPWGVDRDHVVRLAEIATPHDVTLSEMAGKPKRMEGRREGRGSRGRFPPSVGGKTGDARESEQCGSPTTCEQERK